MPIPPEPNYSYSTTRLTNTYKKAVQDILRELERLDLTAMQRAHTQATLKIVAEILSELNKESAEWVETNISIASREGVARSILALGVVETIQEAEKLVTFNRMNQNMVNAAIADTQSDLLAVTNNISRKVRSTVRSVTAEVLRENVSKGINGRNTLRREIIVSLRKKLGDAVETGIIDAAGRRWKPEVYVDMLVRTKMLEAHKEATVNEAVNRGALYGVISSHGAKDACKRWEGRIIKLSRDADGSYPYIGDLPRNEIFHPNCRHVVSPVRRPERE
jgi:hypothetical protein